MAGLLRRNQNLKNWSNLVFVVLKDPPTKKKVFSKSIDNEVISIKTEIKWMKCSFSKIFSNIQRTYYSDFSIGRTYNKFTF